MTTPTSTSTAVIGSRGRRSRRRARPEVGRQISRTLARIRSTSRTRRAAHPTPAGSLEHAVPQTPNRTDHGDAQCQPRPQRHQCHSHRWNCARPASRAAEHDHRLLDADRGHPDGGQQQCPQQREWRHPHPRREARRREFRRPDARCRGDQSRTACRGHPGARLSAGGSRALRRDSGRLSDSGHGSSANCSDRCAGVQLIAIPRHLALCEVDGKHGRERPAPRHGDDSVQPHQTIARRRGFWPGATPCRSVDGGGSYLRKGDIVASDDGSSVRATSRAGPLSAERSAPHLSRRGASRPGCGGDLVLLRVRGLRGGCTGVEI